MLFRGLSAFPITPASSDGIVDTEALSRILARFDGTGIDSIGLLGSTGTYMYLTRAQRRRAIAAAREALNGRIPLMVGIGALRTDDVCDLARDAQSAGADALLLAPVSYTPLTAEEVFQHFATVAQATDLPICIYDNFAATHFKFDDSLIIRLAGLPTVKGLKTSAAPPAEVPQKLAALRPHVPADFSLGFSYDRFTPQALLAGGDAWYSVMAGLLPRETLLLARAAQSGDTAEVTRISTYFQPLWDVFDAASSLRTMYAVAARLGLGDFDPPRPLRSIARGPVEAALNHLSELQKEIASDEHDWPHRQA